MSIYCKFGQGVSRAIHLQGLSCQFDYLISSTPLESGYVSFPLFTPQSRQKYYPSLLHAEQHAGTLPFYLEHAPPFPYAVPMKPFYLRNKCWGDSQDVKSVQFTALTTG